MPPGRVRSARLAWSDPRDGIAPRGPPLNATRSFLASEDGPTAVEYAVMLALIILACFAVIQTFGSAVTSSFADSTARIEAAAS